jgi:hypothetical protein
MPQSVYSMSEPWTPSVRPIIESRIPPELKRWRRWSNHFERDSDTIMGFDMYALSFPNLDSITILTPKPLGTPNA